MARGKGAKAKKPVTSKRLPPIGKGPIKRTPQHEFDHQDNTDNIYDVESILAERSVNIGGRGFEEWLIRWKGYSQAHDTWEPIEHLAGLEDDIAKFRNARAELETLKLGKRKRRSPANPQPVVVPASALASGSQEPTANVPSSDTHGEEDDCEDTTEILRPAMRGRRIAKVWSLFNEITCPVTDKAIGLRCGVEGCGTKLASSTNTTNARQHLSYLHKDYLAEMEAEDLEGGDVITADSNQIVQSQIPANSVKWPSGKRDTLTGLVVKWLAKRCRPLSLPERDTELRDVLTFATDGGYNMPSKHNVVRQLCAMSGKAKAKDRRKVADLRAGRVDPSSAADIWSENGISLLGILLYFWAAGATELSELLVRAVPFGEVAHSGLEIEKATKKALADFGVGVYDDANVNDDFEPVDTVLDCLHKAVADGASNIQKGLADFETSPCPVHAETAEQKRAAEFEKRLAEALKQQSVDANLGNLSGAFVAAAGAGGSRVAERAVHFEDDGLDEGALSEMDLWKQKQMKKKKKLADAKRRADAAKSKKKGKQRYIPSDSESSEVLTIETSDSEEEEARQDRRRRDKQRMKRKMGADLVKEIKSGSARSGGSAGGAKTAKGGRGLGSCADSPDPKPVNYTREDFLRDQAAALAAAKATAEAQAQAVAAAGGGTARVPRPGQTGFPPDPPAAQPSEAVIKMTAAETAKSFRIKAAADNLRMQLVKYQLAEPATAMSMSKTELLTAAMEAHNAGLLDLRAL
ncbi:hypothetical protein CYMTET_21444 [Cymbomonas tetramitiformis]|uniref:Chromo domain-containing protein n=1 Tax=Cymbomonas tetramitiformis TaxID=36881 RepID=A0AAE0G2D2_9CHLO|nr:hypothetical protein CYMTET_21444 [Cymbomonas tetramitiformis]